MGNGPTTWPVTARTAEDGKHYYLLVFLSYLNFIIFIVFHSIRFLINFQITLTPLLFPLTIFVCVSLSVPDNGPATITFSVVSSSVVNVTWTPVPPELRNGIILGYFVSIDDFQTVFLSRKVESLNYVYQFYYQCFTYEII